MNIVANFFKASIISLCWIEAKYRHSAQICKPVTGKVLDLKLLIQKYSQPIKLQDLLISDLRRKL